MSVTTRVNRNIKRSLRVRFYNRQQWGTTKEVQYQWRRKFRKHKLLPKRPVDTIVQHISVTRDSGSKPADFKADMRTLERIGQERFGSGISYNYVVDMETGEIGLGQSLDAAGTHTLNDKNVKGFSFNQNYVALAIAVLGMPGQQLSDKAKLSIATIIAAMMDAGACTRDPDYVPHRLFAFKDCPTDPVVEAMPNILKVAKRLHNS